MARRAVAVNEEVLEVDLEVMALAVVRESGWLWVAVVAAKVVVGMEVVPGERVAWGVTKVVRAGLAVATVTVAEREAMVVAKVVVSMVAVPEGWVVRVVMKAARVELAVATGEVVELEVMAAARAVGGMWAAWVAAKVGRVGRALAMEEVAK